MIVFSISLALKEINTRIANNLGAFSVGRLSLSDTFKIPPYLFMTG